MLKKTFLVVSVLIFCVSFSFGQKKTVVKDAKAKQMLLGNHKLSLQWISWDYFGSAKVSEKKGVLYLKGEQKQKDGNDLLTIDGKITKVEANSFTFEGTILTLVSHINSGQVCIREGKMTFRITGKRKYWRLMQMDNPCDEATDYVDIYFR